MRQRWLCSSRNGSSGGAFNGFDSRNGNDFPVCSQGRSYQGDKGPATEPEVEAMVLSSRETVVGEIYGTVYCVSDRRNDHD